MRGRSRFASAATWVEDRARRLLLRASRADGAGARRPDGEPLRVLFTIDTEVSMGGALRDPELQPVGVDRRIWGETDDGYAGIDLFMDVFDEFGLRAVFFFEVCGRNIVDAEGLARAARHIEQRGHDVELHVHPEFRLDLEAVRQGAQAKPSAILADYSVEEQSRILARAAEVLERWTGRRPTAFRAGGFAGDQRAIEAVANAGIPVDSSYNLWSIGAGPCQFDLDPPLNDVCLLDRGVIEVPVTCYQASGPRGGMRQFDLAAVNATEGIAILEEMYAVGMRVACTVTHSFRLIKTTDVQYTDARPDAFNLHRLRAVCRHLAGNPDRYQVCTYRDLPLERWRRELAGPRAEPHIPSPPTWTSVARLAVQAVKDRGAV